MLGVETLTSWSYAARCSGSVYVHAFFFLGLLLDVPTSSQQRCCRNSRQLVYIIVLLYKRVTRRRCIKAPSFCVEQRLRDGHPNPHEVDIYTAEHGMEDGHAIDVHMEQPGGGVW
ncbi:hypothetical protein VTO73DRAFT_4944 [Trametes versicolor]